MIKEIFITDLNGNVLLGNTSLFLSKCIKVYANEKNNPSINDPCIESNSNCNNNCSNGDSVVIEKISSNNSSSNNNTNSSNTNGINSSNNNTNSNTNSSEDKICRIKVNDTYFYALYSQIDRFSAVKFLSLLKKSILNEITEKNIKRHYFSLIELIKSPEMIWNKGTSNKNKGDIFVDIIQTILPSDKNNKNTVYGSILLNRCPPSFKITFKKDPSVSFRSTYPFKESNDNTLILTGNSNCNNKCSNKFNNKCNGCSNCCNSISSSNTNSNTNLNGSVNINLNTKIINQVINQNVCSNHLLDFNYSNSVIYFTVNRTGNKITIQGNPNQNFKYQKFKFILFKIPVGKDVYKVERTVSGGDCKFSLEEGLVYWKFEDCVFKKEHLKMDLLKLQDFPRDETREKIKVDFQIENDDSLPLKILNCVGLNEEKFWMKTTTICKDYFIE